MTIENLTYLQSPNYRDQHKHPDNKHLKQRVAIPRLKTSGLLQKIAFFGSADIKETDPLYQEAFNAAQMLARNGKTIVNGGGPGIMNASTQGAKSVEGDTLGITFYPEDMPEFEGRESLNLVDQEFRTANYIERMMGLLSESDAFVVFKGGTGTLSEWATAWLLGHLYYDKFKPLFLYGEFWHEFMESVNQHFMIGKSEQKVYKIVNNLPELLEAIHKTEKEFAKTYEGIQSEPVK